MRNTLTNTFVKIFKTCSISFVIIGLIGCISPNTYFYSYHLPDNKKAAFLHQLVHSLSLDSSSRLRFKLYGDWLYSLTPLDMDKYFNGICKTTRFAGGKHRVVKNYQFYQFFSDVFGPEIKISSRKESDCGYELYLEEFDQQDNFNAAVNLALLRFEEIAQRLEVLYFEKLELKEKYDNINHLTKSIDEDIISISVAGFQLANSTKQFFQLAKTQLVLQDVASVRNKGIGNLKSFSDKLEAAKATQFSTIEEATLATIAALESLKQDISQ